MDDEQASKIEALQSKLIDELLFEADPDNWPGTFSETGERKHPFEMTQEERGDRFWSKKNANATLSLINKIESLSFWRNRGTRPNPLSEDQETDLEKEIAKNEKIAETMLNRYHERRMMKDNAH